MKIRENNFRLELEEGALKDFEKVVLSEINDVFIPMGFIRSSEGELITYNCSGYSSLKQCNLTDACEALEIMEKTFIQVSRASEYLIAPSKITLSLNTIFYNKDTHQVRIAYVPEQTKQMNLRENMAGFIKEMEGSVEETGKPYLQKIKNQMEENNYYIQDLINVIGEIRRSISSIMQEEVLA